MTPSSGQYRDSMKHIASKKILSRILWNEPIVFVYIFNFIRQQTRVFHDYYYYIFCFFLIIIYNLCQNSSHHFPFFEFQEAIITRLCLQLPSSFLSSLSLLTRPLDPPHLPPTSSSITPASNLFINHSINLKIHLQNLLDCSSYSACKTFQQVPA